MLAATAVALAGLARNSEIVELSWFVNPLLIITGLKLLVEDLRHGKPVGLFLAFACFGIALIVAPRLRRRAHSADSSQRSAEESGAKL